MGYALAKTVLVERIPGGLSRPMLRDQQLSDVEFQRLKQGDQQVFRRIYEQYVHFVYFVVRKYRLPEQVLDDVVQDVFLKFYDRRAALQAADKIPSWLGVCARHQAIDYWRKNRRTVLREIDEAEQEISDLPAEIREAELTMVENFLQQVRLEPGGESFYLFYAKGLSAKEIAAANDEALSTVTTRLSRLRRKFREQLQEALQEIRDRHWF